MNDPHVESIRYDAVSERADLRYQDPPPVEHDTPLANYRLENGNLIVHPHEHYATEDEARHALEPFIRAWEYSSDISGPVGSLRFHFNDADIIDRNPPPQTPGIINVTARDNLHLSASMSASVTRGKYPDPPVAFNAESEVVIFLMELFRLWKQGSVPILPAAYAMLTCIEREAGEYTTEKKGKKLREYTGNRFLIHIDVLNNVGELSSARLGSTPAQTRKFGPTVTKTITPNESDWLVAAIPAIIRQVATVESGATHDPLSMDKLPTLNTQE